MKKIINLMLLINVVHWVKSLIEMINNVRKFNYKIASLKFKVKMIVKYVRKNIIYLQVNVNKTQQVVNRL